jgi:hypothetical protein
MNIQNHGQPARGYDIMRPALEPQEPVKSEYRDGNGKTNQPPQMFTREGQPLYDSQGNLDWWATHEKPTDKPCLQPSPAMAVPMPVLTPTPIEAEACELMRKRMSEPLSESKLAALAAMSKQPEPEAKLDPIFDKMRREIATLELEAQREPEPTPEPMVVGEGL